MFLTDTVLSHVETVSDAPDLSGTRYELVELIGRGGMGTVWLARDRELERDVAVKVSAHELTREARVVAQLEHPGIVPVHDSGKLPDGRVFYVMKLVRGERLDLWARDKELRVRLRLFQRVCEAVAFAHARGVLHRDLKPENVMVGEFGEALVMDWGLARRRVDGAEPPGTVLGTPAYMAPEAARGEEATAAADVYGLGAVLHALVSGRPPFDGSSGKDVVAKVARGEPPLALPAPGPVVAICAKAMARAPGDRYGGALEVGDDVGRFLEQEPVSAYREPLLERVVRFVSKNGVVLSLLGAYLLLRLVLLLL